MIPSLLQIPSAVSDSKLHSVLPNNGKGDFQFERSTGATRINKDGLIEEVGYFSSELVQNGNFSELGSELVTNGDFSNGATDWGLESGWSIINTSINDNKAYYDMSRNSSHIQQSLSTNSAKTYKITFTVSGVEDGKNARFAIWNSTNGSTTFTGYVSYQNGTQTLYLSPTGSGTVLFFNALNSNPTDSTFYLDNVSVKQVDPNDRWTLGTGTTISDSKANFSNATSVSLYQDIGLSSGFVKVTFSVTDYTSGTLKIYIGGYSIGTSLIAATSVGSYSAIIDTSSGNGNIIFGSSDNFTGSIDNISVVEVQGDRPRLSYDITNGVVEDKPHLLLEPSSTNLIKFSEDFSQISLLQSTITTNNIKSPNGLIKGNLWLANATSAAKELQEQYSVTSGTTYTESWFVKYKSLQFIQMVTTSATFGAFYGNFDLVNGTKGNSNYTNCSIEAYPDGWYRIQATQVATSTGTGRLGGLRMIASATASRGGSITTDGTEGVYVWGHQVEQQSYATSYIPTAGTTITRAAETCNNSKPSVNSTEGVLYAEIAALTDLGSYRLISLSDGTSVSNRITILYNIADNQIYGQCVASSSTQAFVLFQPTSISDFHKIAFKYKANDFQLWVDGVKVGTDTIGSTPTGLSRLSFDRADGVDDWYGKVKGLAVYNEALSESQLMQLTGVTASSIYNNFVTRTASFTVEALNEVKKVIDNL